MQERPRNPHAIFLLLVAAWAILPACDGVYEAGPDGRCTDCVVLDTVAHLDFGPAPTLPSPAGMIVRNENGDRWAFVDPQVRSEVLIFDGEGTFLGMAGGEGDGPGEFRTIHTLFFDSTDTLWVVSDRGGRADLFGPDAEFARGMRLDPRVNFAAPLADGRTVVVAFEGSGSSLQLLGRGGAMEPVPGIPLEDHPATRVILESDGSERYWVAEPAGYRVWEGRVGGDPILLTGSAPGWFSATFPDDVQEVLGLTESEAGGTILRLQHDPHTDLLWLTAGVPVTDLDIEQVRAAMTSSDPEVQAGIAGMLADFMIVGLRGGTGEEAARGLLDQLHVRPGTAFEYVVQDASRLSVLAPAVLDGSGPAVHDPGG